MSHFTIHKNDLGEKYHVDAKTNEICVHYAVSFAPPSSPYMVMNALNALRLCKQTFSRARLIRNEEDNILVENIEKYTFLLSQSKRLTSEDLD